MTVHIDTEQALTPSSQETAENASPKMDPALKEKWVEALRSGEFTQARNSIGNAAQKHLCCLGVGAVVANPSIELNTTDDALDELGKHGLDVFRGRTRIFSPAVGQLVHLNDGELAPFSVIADHIEKNL